MLGTTFPFRIRFGFAVTPVPESIITFEVAENLSVGRMQTLENCLYRVA